MSEERQNPDIFWTDEEVAELKARGIISEESPAYETDEDSGLDIPF